MQWFVTFAPHYTKPHVYLDWLAREDIAGTAYKTDAPCPSDLNRFDALLLSGGGDVGPALYGAETEPETYHADDRRDAVEIDLILRFIAMGKPVYGICRGIQILNVALGGRLVQHVPRWLERHAHGGVAREQHDGAHEKDARHAVRTLADRAMGRALAHVGETNSMHHQAIDPAALASRLAVAALSPAGVIEAVEGLDFAAPVQAVQWHPERLDASCPASGVLLRHWKMLTSGA